MKKVCRSRTSRRGQQCTVPRKGENMTELSFAVRFEYPPESTMLCSGRALVVVGRPRQDIARWSRGITDFERKESRARMRTACVGFTRREALYRQVSLSCIREALSTTRRGCAIFLSATRPRWSLPPPLSFSSHPTLFFPSQMSEGAHQKQVYYTSTDYPCPGQDGVAAFAQKIALQRGIPLIKANKSCLLAKR